MQVALIIAHKDYQPVEYNAPKKILESAGIKVVTVSDVGGIAKAAYDGDESKIDMTVDDCKPEDFDGVFLVGGSGAEQYLENEKVYKIIREVAVSHKLWGAICYSTRILAHAGVLSGRKATGWDGDGELGGILRSVGAEYIREPVVMDGDLFTATGPKFAEAWGDEILQKLK